MLVSFLPREFLPIWVLPCKCRFVNKMPKTGEEGYYTQFKGLKANCNLLPTSLNEQNTYTLLCMLADNFFRKIQLLLRLIR